MKKLHSFEAVILEKTAPPCCFHVDLTMGDEVWIKDKMGSDHAVGSKVIIDTEFDIYGLLSNKGITPCNIRPLIDGLHQPTFVEIVK